MSRLPHIAVESSSTIDGRACQKVTYSEPLRFFAAGQSYCFDPATTQIVEEQQTTLGSTEFRSTVTTFEYVAAVPAVAKTEAAKTAAKDQAKAGRAPRATPSAERTPARRVEGSVRAPTHRVGRACRDPSMSETGRRATPYALLLRRSPT